MDRGKPYMYVCTLNIDINAVKMLIYIFTVYYCFSPVNAHRFSRHVMLRYLKVITL